MRRPLVRELPSVLLVAMLVGASGCNNDPTGFDVKTTSRLLVDPTSMVLRAGRSAELEVQALNEGGEPTFEAVDFRAAACAGPGSVSVAKNPARLAVQPPGRLLVTGGNDLGAACVIVSAAAVTDTVEVVVAPEAIALVSPPDTLRAGEGTTLTARLEALDSSAVSPFDQAADATWSSDLPAVASVGSDGTVTTSQAGSATLTVTWSGTEATSTAGLGLSVSASTSLTVIPNVPASAELADFAPLAAGSSAEGEVLVLDARGNQNAMLAEIQGAQASSSDAAVATATARVDTLTDEATGAQSVRVVVTAEGVAARSATVSGTVSTISGVLPFSASVTVQ